MGSDEEGTRRHLIETAISREVLGINVHAAAVVGDAPMKGTIKVQVRRVKQKRKAWPGYAYVKMPELRLTAGWLRRAGFREGDELVVSSPRPYSLVLTVKLTGVERMWRAVGEAAVEAIRADRRAKIYRRARILSGEGDL